MADRDAFDEVFGDEELTTETTEEVVEPAAEADADAEEPADVEDGAEVEDGSEDAEPAEEPDYKALYEREQQRFRSELGRRKQLEEKLKVPPQTPKEPVPTTPSPEDEFLTKFRETYNDDVLRAIELISTRKARELLGQVESQRVNPLNDTVHSLLQKTHFDTIAAAHPDWEQVRDDPVFAAWIESQPMHRRRAYVEVIDQGTPSEIVGLLTEFKDSRKKPKSTPPNPTKVQSATAVKAPRGALPSKAAPAKDDWDAAWEEASR